MILATRFTFIVEKSWKNMYKYFHSKMACPPPTYDVISRNHRNWPTLNLTQNLCKGWTNGYLKHQVLMFYPIGENLEKPYGGVPSTPAHPLVRLRVKIMTALLEMLGRYCMKWKLIKCCDTWKSKRFQITYDILYANLLLQVCSIFNDFFSCYKNTNGTLGRFLLSFIQHYLNLFIFCCTFCGNFWKAHKSISVLKMIHGGYSRSF